MRTHLVAFVLTALSIYAALNAYVFVHGWRAIPQGSHWRTAYLVAFLFVSSSFVAGRFIERDWVSPLSTFLIWTGAFWLAAMLYFFLICLFVDFARMANFAVPFFPQLVTSDYPRAGAVSLVVSIALVALLLIGGHINSRFLRVRTVRIDVPKEVPGRKTLSIVMASDIHLGSIVGPRRLHEIVEQIDALNGDLVVLPGDIVDEDLSALISKDVGKTLKDLHAPLGVIAVTGNHEYIGGIAPAVKYLTEHNVRLLRDEVVRLPGDIYVVGREDRSMRSFTGVARKSLAALMAEVDTSHPVILLDHQPSNLAEGADAGADIELCGHTHNGQLWPWTYATRAVYDLNYGYAKVGNMHVYVSSGAGTWGPPVRIGTSAEIVNVVVTFK
jgi:uncharacterized protein